MKTGLTPAVFLFLISITAFSQIQPQQPLTGYGGSTYAYDSVVIVNHDDGPTGFMLYFPATPHADSLPVVIFNHGYNAWNPMGYGSWINHIIKRGNIVIFPMYQKSAITSPALFTPNADTGVLRALDTLRAHPEYTQAILSKLCIVGHSYGGVVTANMGVNYAAYGLPKPAAIMGAAPGYGTAPQGLLPTYRNMDSSIAILQVFELDDNVVDSVFALEIFDSTVLVPYAHKNLIVHHPDSTGNPPCVSSHGQACGVDSAYDNGDTGPIITLTNRSQTDAVDYYCYWKLFDALQDCALNGNGCTTAFGDTYAQKFAGTWSDSVAIVPLEVRPEVSQPNALMSVTIENITLAPNPATNHVKISLEAGSADHVTVSNILGQEMVYKKIDPFIVSFSIDLSGSAPGIYLIHFTDGNMRSYTQKLVLAQ